MTIPRTLAIAALLVLPLAGCGDDRPATPDLSGDVIALVDAGTCSNLQDNLGRARDAKAHPGSAAWGEQYEALLLWKGRALSCSWADGS